MYEWYTRYLLCSQRVRVWSDYLTRVNKSSERWGERRPLLEVVRNLNTHEYVSGCLRRFFESIAAPMFYRAAMNYTNAIVETLLLSLAPQYKTNQFSFTAIYVLIQQTSQFCKFHFDPSGIQVKCRRNFRSSLLFLVDQTQDNVSRGCQLLQSSLSCR